MQEDTISPKILNEEHKTIKITITKIQQKIIMKKRTGRIRWIKQQNKTKQKETEKEMVTGKIETEIGKTPVDTGKMTKTK